MKLLLISHKFYPDIGGIEINSEILAFGFHEARHEVRVITWTTAKGDREFPFVVIRNPSHFALLKEHYYADVIMENNPSLRLSWPAVIFNKPTIVALCTWLNRIEGRLAWQDRLKIFWLKRASTVIAVSNAVRTRCWAQAVVISNPYRQDLFRVLPNIHRNRDFVFIGRLVTDKGADVAINALYQLLVENYKFNLTIIGNGTELDHLQKLTQDLGIANQVEFTGTLQGEKLVACLNQHKYLLVPSKWEEPFGNVALEGMACGCLPIVSDGGGLPDAVGEAGLVVKRGSIEAFVQCIKNVINDTGLERKLRDAAPAHLANHHPNVIFKQYLTLVEETAIIK